MYYSRFAFLNTVWLQATAEACSRRPKAWGLERATTFEFNVLIHASRLEEAHLQTSLL
jgi:hypothetical protein